PIEARYGSREMRSIFEFETRFQRMLDVEAALAKALANVGLISKADAGKIAQSASIKRIGVKRICEFEREVKHETMALVLALAKASGKAGRFVHLGATSNDILDTAAALQIRDGLAIVERDLRKLLRVVLNRATRHKNTIMVGRTHGQHAVPTTLGLKFAIWACELGRHLQRLKQLKPRVIAGKMSGAVGTGAAWGIKGPRIQELVMQELELPAATASNQILQRDRFAELVSFFGLLGSTLDKIAREIRNLQRTEIGELAEPFAARQIGSSTMPQKRNPIRCEKICGLARVLRANSQAALENVVLEHERDLTNSSCERVLLPESFLLIDEMLKTSIFVLDNLLVFPDQMKRNLELTRGLNMAEAVMIELTRRGLSRQEAHAVLRRCSAASLQKDVPLAAVLSKERKVTKYITVKELEKFMDPRRYLGSAAATVTRVGRELRPLAK
ncbi:MAG: adenylosuccinate lyase, partial [Hadesarchaea archaeon]|nr:adenylosuccinate lyase [Hadesarchaea archaeon]